MKKILLVLFLFSFASNVIAKEKIWSCHNLTKIYGDVTKKGRIISGPSCQHLYF